MSTSRKIIKKLEDRSGFDEWWESISEATQNEILDEIDDIIREDWEA